MTVTPQGEGVQLTMIPPREGAQPTLDQSRQSSTPANQLIEGSTSSNADRSIDGPAASAALQTPVGSHLNSSSMTNTLMGSADSSSAVPNSVVEDPAITTVQRNFLPDNRKQINRSWAVDKWNYAHKLRRDLPVENPQPDHYQQYIELGTAIWDFVRNSLVQRRHDYLNNYALKDGLACAKSPDLGKCIETIHSAVLDNWDHTKSKDDVQNWRDYLKNVMRYMRLPLKEEKVWIKLAIQDVEARWKIRFEYHACIKHSVDAIAMKLFNNCHKQRQRRGTVKCANIAFYDRIVPKSKLKTLFGEEMVTDSIPETFNLGCHTLKGHIVFVVTEQRKALVTKNIVGGTFAVDVEDSEAQQNESHSSELFVDESLSRLEEDKAPPTVAATRESAGHLQHQQHHPSWQRSQQQQGQQQWLQQHQDQRQQQVQQQAQVLWMQPSGPDQIQNMPRSTGVQSRQPQRNQHVKPSAIPRNKVSKEAKLPPWGSYVDLTTRPWLGMALGTNSKCGKFYISRKGRIYESLQQMNNMARAEADKHFKGLSSIISEGGKTVCPSNMLVV